MRTYEALYIVNPELDDDAAQTVAQEVETLITDNGGAIVRSEIWGKRKLAYEVKKFTEGNYVLVRFEAEPTFISRLEAHFRLADPIIRYLVTHLDPHSLRMEAEQQKRKEEDLARSASRRDRDDEEGEGRRRSRRDDDEDEDDERDDRRRSYSRRGRDEDEDED